MKRQRNYTSASDYKLVADRMWDDIFKDLLNGEPQDYKLVGFAMHQCNKADWAAIREGR